MNEAFHLQHSVTGKTPRTVPISLTRVNVKVVLQDQDLLLRELIQLNDSEGFRGTLDHHIKDVHGFSRCPAERLESCVRRVRLGFAVGSLQMFIDFLYPFNPSVRKYAMAEEWNSTLGYGCEEFILPHQSPWQVDIPYYRGGCSFLGVNQGALILTHSHISMC